MSIWSRKNPRQAHTALVSVHSSGGPGKGLIASSEGFTLLFNFAPQLPRDIRVEEGDNMLLNL